MNRQQRRSMQYLTDKHCPNCGLSAAIHPLATDPTYRVAFQSEEQPEMNCHFRIGVSKLLETVVFYPAERISYVGRTLLDR